MKFQKNIWWLLIFLPFSVLSQPSPKKLEQQIEQLASGFNGSIGIYVKNLKTGESACLNCDTIFPTASMIKVPILIGIMDKIEKGELSYHQPLLYHDSLSKMHDDEEDILASFKDKEKIELSKVMMLMLTMSDNTASLWLQSLAGGGTAINKKLNEIGLLQTRVNSRTIGREEEQTKFGWGQTTPREMVTLFEKIYKGEIINKNASERMLRLLGRNYWDEECIGQLPFNVFIADKVGAVDASRSETLLAVAPNGPYIFSVITKNQADTSWKPENEGWVLERKLSHLLWNYFEPQSRWKPIIDFKGNWIKKSN